MTIQHGIRQVLWPRCGLSSERSTSGVFSASSRLSCSITPGGDPAGSPPQCLLSRLNHFEFPAPLEWASPGHSQFLGQRLYIVAGRHALNGHPAKFPGGSFSLHAGSFLGNCAHFCVCHFKGSLYLLHLSKFRGGCMKPRFSVPSPSCEWCVAPLLAQQADPILASRLTSCPQDAVTSSHLGRNLGLTIPTQWSRVSPLQRLYSCQATAIQRLAFSQ